MEDIIIGVDLAKRIFQLHGATGSGELLFRKRLTRDQFRAGSMPMMVTSDIDVLSFCDGFNNHHIGTLRCRQEGASTPSTEQVGTMRVGRSGGTRTPNQGVLSALL